MIIPHATIANFLKSRDELTIQNIRRDLWPLLLVFPLSVIIGDLRYFDLKMEISGYQSYELMLFPLGLGWLASAFFPKRLFIPMLRTAAVLSAVLLPFEILMPPTIHRLEVFMAFQFFNGICAACAFSLFCFKLNNVERLCAMIIITFYYGFYYTIWRAFPAVQTVGKTWGSIAVMAVYLVVVFASPTRRVGDNSKKHEPVPETEKTPLTPPIGGVIRHLPRRGVLHDNVHDQLCRMGGKQRIKYGFRYRLFRFHCIDNFHTTTEQPQRIVFMALIPSPLPVRSRHTHI